MYWLGIFDNRKSVTLVLVQEEYQILACPLDISNPVRVSFCSWAIGPYSCMDIHEISWSYKNN